MMRGLRDFSLKPLIYFLERADGCIKIGTTTDYRTRFVSLQRKYGPLTLLGWIHGNYLHERKLHGQFAAFRQDGEWFAPAPSLIEYIHQVREAGKPPKFSTFQKQKQKLWLEAVLPLEPVITELQNTVQVQAAKLRELDLQVGANVIVMDSLERENADLRRQLVEAWRLVGNLEGKLERREKQT